MTTTMPENLDKTLDKVLFGPDADMVETDPNNSPKASEIAQRYV